MVWDELSLKRCQRAIDRFMATCRPPLCLRDQLDYACRIEGRSIELLAIRPFPLEQVMVRREYPIARATYVQTQGVWQIYHLGSDQRWHRYKPTPTVRHPDQFFDVIREDEYGCFFG